MWFNRVTYDLELLAGPGISSVTGAGSYKYGKEVDISATPNTGSGYSFSNWVVNSGATPSSTTSASTNITMYEATSLTAYGLDSSAPTPSITTTSTLKSSSQTATLNCTDSSGVTSYYWGTTYPTSSSEYTNITNTTNMNINKIFNININNIEVYQKENNYCKSEDEGHKSFNSCEYSESLEEEIELEQELDEIYSIKKINSPRCLSYDYSNTENSKNILDKEDEPEELILDINEEPDFMLTNICERENH